MIFRFCSPSALALPPALVFTAFCILPVQAQPPPNYQLPDDWLVHPGNYPASITASGDKTGTILLDNGLVRRTLDLRLGTTTGFLNHMTGESIIRAVEPELTISLDGTNHVAGAVTGQTNKAFLSAPEIAALQPASSGFRYVGHAINPIAAHLEWPVVRHHAPATVWPPKGKTLRVDYDLMATAPKASADLDDSDVRRKLLFADDFATLRDDWKVRRSPLHERSSFDNEAKPGEIYTLPNTAVFAERAVPAEMSLAEAVIHPGTDNSTSWGPGLALVFSSGRVIKFHLRPGGLQNVNRPVLGLCDNEREDPNVSGTESIDTSKAWTLRLRRDGNRWLCEARPDAGQWKRYAAIDVPPADGPPSTLRVGKMDRNGGANDRDAAGDLVRLKVDRVRLYGPEQEEPATALPAADIRLSIHYALYDNLPLLAKWFTLTNRSGRAVNLDSFVLEQLAVVEHDNTVDDHAGLLPPDALHVETDMAFGGMDYRASSRHTVHWEKDPDFHTQVTYSKSQPCLLKVRPFRGPDQAIPNGASFESFRTYVMACDTSERERRGLALRRMYRTIAPWVTENPLMFHLLNSNPDEVKKGIDQAAEVGFEMVILSFGSGFNAENNDPAYLAKWKEINDYARGKGIDLGSYSLYSSRRIGGGNDIVPPAGMRATHGVCPAVTSPWGRDYLAKLGTLHESTGFRVFEHDGPYPGDIDATARPPLQKGEHDSQWVHWKIWADFYSSLRAKGVYLNLPDYYYLAGSNKCAMGYREVNWALPREQQRIHTRQNIYDGTWEKTPSMGWMFVPLASYQGGGAAATIEPLDTHRDHYRMMLLSNLGLGVQACYRGPRLYDTDATREMVKTTVAWFKQHRDILESDLIHGRRADGRDLDWMLHVNPTLDTKAMLAAYNPTDQPITREIAVPLYYSGLRGTATCTDDATGKSAVLPLDTISRARLTVTIPAQSQRFFLFRQR